MVEAFLGATIAITVLLVLSPELRESIVDQFARWRRRARRIFVRHDKNMPFVQWPRAVVTQSLAQIGLGIGVSAHRDIEFDRETNDRIVELFGDRNLRVTYSKDSPDTIHISDPCNAFHFLSAGEIPFQEFFEKVYGDDAQMESVLFKMKYG